MFGSLFRLPFKAARKTAGKIRSRLARINGKDGFIILDFRDKTIHLPNGDIIRKDDILNFDPQTGTLVYRSPTGELKTITITNAEEPEDKALRAILESLTRKRQDTGTITYV